MARQRTDQERQFFHPRVASWLRKQGYKDENIWRECKIGSCIPDFILFHGNRYAMIECKTWCNYSGLNAAIGQVSRYSRVVDYYLDRPHNVWHGFVKHRFEGLQAIHCLAVGSLYHMTFDEAFGKCADNGILLINPGYEIDEEYPTVLNARYPFASYQLPLFDKIPYQEDLV
jgi:hypothetical protein